MVIFLEWVSRLNRHLLLGPNLFSNQNPRKVRYLLACCIQRDYMSKQWWNKVGTWRDQAQHTVTTLRKPPDVFGVWRRSKTRHMTMEAEISANQGRDEMKRGGENSVFECFPALTSLLAVWWISTSDGGLHQLSEVLTEEIWLVGTQSPG